jgi:hypothetical protein
MKYFICLLLLNLPFSFIFSQNVPIDVILSYQDDVMIWLNENNLLIKSQSINYNGVELFIEPYISKSPEQKIFGKGGSIIDCFGVGRFLTIPEAERIYAMVYSSVPQNDRQIFFPFETLDNFKNSLIFNPKIFFNIPGNDILDLDGKYAYLVFYFSGYSERYSDTVFNIQFEQLINENSKEIFISPYSWYYALFRMCDNGEIELISYYGIN